MIVYVCFALPTFTQGANIIYLSSPLFKTLMELHIFAQVIGPRFEYQALFSIESSAHPQI